MPERPVEPVAPDARVKCWTPGCGRWHSGAHVIDGVEVHTVRCLECATRMYRRAWEREAPYQRQSGI